MSTLDEINAQRDAAIAILNDKLMAANDLKNNGAAGMDPTINSLAQQRAAVAAQAYAAGLSDPAMAQALTKITAATTQMNTVAAKMVSATAFITNLANLLTASNGVISALKGI